MIGQLIRCNNIGGRRWTDDFTCTPDLMSLGEADMFFPRQVITIRYACAVFGKELFLATLFNASTLLLTYHLCAKRAKACKQLLCSRSS